ncbi:hypothetical protein CKO28_03395 [Rhodovibrio sodomensis]|uniref:Probable periplasmic serine endoprotease DegP-like n=1 Tax=Rhodovibrio sodomensis TaxID=1088 RepID=A0ABS1D9Q8_9PROT|nr:DegQ family serine endoprotease [Rhodovibrio sodomensis]MBK1667090.1 hypothetical protein [Rhodovibrio sodomensis]
MTRTLRFGAAGAMILGAVASAAPVAAQETPPSFAPVVKDLLPAVVNISTRKTVDRGPQMPFEQLPEGHPLREFFERFGGGQRQAPRQMRSLGSGFIVDESGYIVTNQHVVKKADQVTVVLRDKTRLDAEIVGTDKATDLALLKVETKRDLPEVDWGNSAKAEIGDWALAIGNPFGLGGSVTAGIISARGREIKAGPYSRFIQTDTAINQGNSGGPLFNADGKVIGVNTAILSPSGGNVGVGFALPSKVAKPIIAELKQDGEVTRGWLGVMVQPITPQLAKGLEIPAEDGALIGNVVAGSPAAKGGLKQGDVITKVEGQAIEDAGELAWRVSQHDPGEQVELTIWRNGEKTTETVTLGKRSEDKMASAEPAIDGDAAAQLMGVKLADVGPRTRERFDLSQSADEVVVTRVAPGSPAASQGIQPGDVIAQIGRQEVDTPQQVNELLRKAAQAGSDGVVVLLRRDGNSQFVPVPLASPEQG